MCSMDMHMLMRDADMFEYMYLYEYVRSFRHTPSTKMLTFYMDILVYEYVNHLKFPFPLTFFAKTLWVPAHCKISSENFVGARAPRTRRSAPHGTRGYCTCTRLIRLYTIMLYCTSVRNLLWVAILLQFQMVSGYSTTRPVKEEHENSWFTLYSNSLKTLLY